MSVVTQKEDLEGASGDQVILCSVLFLVVIGWWSVVVSNPPCSCCDYCNLFSRIRILPMVRRLY